MEIFENHIEANKRKINDTQVNKEKLQKPSESM
jgi:hypothetical protein